MPTVHSNPIAPASFSAIRVTSQPNDSLGIKSQSASTEQLPMATDSFRIALKGSAETGRSANQIQFGAAVHVEETNPAPAKLLGMIRLTENQELQIQSAENRAFHRFDQPGNNITRGSINAKIRHSATNIYQPGYLEHGSGLTLSDDERKQVTNALKDYGEDIASIAIVGRDKKELSNYLEDKAFIFVFDKDKDDFEDYIKDGFHDFFGAAEMANPQTQTASTGKVSANAQGGGLESPSENGKADHSDKKSEYRWRFFRPRFGVNVRGLDFEKTKVKAQVELAKLQGPAHTEVKVLAKVPFTFGGEYNIEGEVRARRVINYKPGEYGEFKDNMYLESNTNYNHEEARVRSTFGVRKQISADSSLGIYGSGTLSTAGEKHDVGLGVNYQLKFD